MKARVPISRDEAEQQLTEATAAAARRASVNGVALGAKTVALLALQRYAQPIRLAGDYETLRAATDDLLAYLQKSAKELATHTTPEEPNA